MNGEDGNDDGKLAVRKIFEKPFDIDDEYAPGGEIRGDEDGDEGVRNRPGNEYDQRGESPYPDDVPPDDGRYYTGDYNIRGPEGSQGDGGDAGDDGPTNDDYIEGAFLDNNDIGNGQRVVKYYGRDLAFVPAVGWHVWNGVLWQRDVADARTKISLKARRRVHGLIDHMKAEADAIQLFRDERELVALAERNKVEFKKLDAMAVDDLEADDALSARYDELSEQQMTAKQLTAQLAKIRQQHRKYAVSTGNSQKLTNALGEASPYLETPLDELDADAMKLNTQNCTLSFEVVPAGDEPGALPFARINRHDHSRADKMTKTLRCDYDPDATAPKFRKFMEQMQPDPEVRAFLARWHAYGLLGHQNEQKLVFYFGAGANGKSTLTALIERMMGEYATNMAIEAITGTDERKPDAATPDFVKLPGARYVNVVEPKENAVLKESMVKRLTGGDMFRARFMQQEFFDFPLLATITISGNHKPVIKGGDWGIWRRMMLVKWGVIIPEDQKDETLGDQLWAEASGVLNWILEDGMTDYLVNGLNPPKAVLEATNEYRGDSDLAGDFINRCCVITEDDLDQIKAKDFNNAFNFFLSENGTARWGARALSNALTAKAGNHTDSEGRMFVHKRLSAGMVYQGVRFSNSFMDEYDPHDPLDNPPERR